MQLFKHFAFSTFVNEVVETPLSSSTFVVDIVGAHLCFPRYVNEIVEQLCVATCVNGIVEKRCVFNINNNNIYIYITALRGRVCFKCMLLFSDPILLTLLQGDERGMP